jgi:hypothetical protein
MKKTFSVLILLFCLFLIIGCQSSIRKPPVNVIIEGGDSFPNFLAGKWVSDKGWEFVFEPNGVISSAVIDNGMVNVRPATERIATIPMQMGGKGVYKLGQWTVQYSPDTRELAVEVVVEHFRLDMGSNALEGNSTDWFVGRVSEDWQVWEADWVSIPKYIALTPEPGELPVDAEDYPRGIIIFKKLPSQENN